MRRRKHAKLLSFSAHTLFLFALIAGVFFAAGVFFERLADRVFAPDSNLSKSESAKDENNLPISASYPSPRLTFVFTLYKLAGEDACVFSMTDNKGEAIDVSRLLGIEKIPCTLNDGKLEGGFKDWLDDSVFTIDAGRGRLLEVDAATQTTLRI
jgi:hypothetical protein